MTVSETFSVLAWLPASLDDYRVEFQESGVTGPGEACRSSGRDYTADHAAKVVYL